MIKFKQVVICCVILTVSLITPRSLASTVASERQFPYQAAVITDDGWCGGVIISKNWILTSAQCIERSDSLTVILGAHNIALDEDTQVIQEISKSNVFLHEEWDRATLLNDIAAVGLSEPIQFTEHIKPVTLPPVMYSGLVFDGYAAVTSGWSYLRSSELRYKDVTIAKTDDCSSYFEDSDSNIPVICLDMVDDVCRGDLGSPLFLKDASTTLIGLASYGWSSGCLLGEPAIFTRVTSYIRWIYETTGVINHRY